MLETDKAQIINDIRGINEQLALTDPARVAAVYGTFPEKIGLQSRFPGKLLLQKLAYPIYGIAVFYNVYGRKHMLLEGLNLTIEPVEWDSFSFSWKMPWSPDKYDDFESYMEAPILSPTLGHWPSLNPGVIWYLGWSIWDSFESYFSGSIADELLTDTPGGINIDWGDHGIITLINKSNHMDFESLTEGDKIESELEADTGDASSDMVLGDIDFFNPA